MFSLDSLCNKISRQRRHHVQKSQKQMFAECRQTPNTFLLASLQHAPLSYPITLFFPNTSHLHFHLVIESMHSQFTGDSQTHHELWDRLNIGTCAQKLSCSPFSHLFVSFPPLQKVWFSISILQSLQWQQFDRLKIQAVNQSYKKQKKLNKNLAPAIFL